MDLICAVDESWAIGKNNALLYHLPEDLRFFKETTMGKALVCGKKTLLSFPGGKPLPGRRHFVLTHSRLPKNEQITVSRSVPTLLKKVKKAEKETGVFLAGGASVYAQLYRYCKKAYITKIRARAEDADAHFPDLDSDPAFALVSESEVFTSKNGLRYSFCVYENLSPLPY